MTKKEYIEELKCLEKYDVSIEEKIKFIENLYILINMNFTNFTKNNWHILN